MIYVYNIKLSMGARTSHTRVKLEGDELENLSKEKFCILFDAFYKVYREIDHPSSVTRKKSPNVYRSCPKMISLGK